MDDLLNRLRNTQALAHLVGEAPAFLTAIRELPAMARSDATVLVLGETGTGKELVARAIHYLSHRAAFPFIPVNCGALPDTLLEDELFGHERGSFTDAHAKRQGLLGQAEKGTLFLDEIDTLSAKAQIDLLRVVQEKRFRPLGSGLELRANIRVVAASNSPLDLLVRNGSFRADLYYRLCVFSVHLPPLRARREDVVQLALHFLKKHAPSGRGDLQLTPDACEALLRWDWPGNVRELENALIRGIHLTTDNCVDSKGLRLGAPDSEEPGTISIVSGKLESLRNMKRRVVDQFERGYLIRLMSEHGGNVTQAALFAGKERRDLGKLLKKHRLDPKGFHAGNTPKRAAS